jgi:hypothetical protein
MVLIYLAVNFTTKFEAKANYFDYLYLVKLYLTFLSITNVFPSSSYSLGGTVKFPIILKIIPNKKLFF